MNNSIDRKEAERHLQLLDPTATEFTFQLFDDNKDRRSSELARVLSGTLDEVWNRLCAYSERGAGVFVTVNETDGIGRKLENMKRVRAVFQEADKPGATVPPLEPHIIIESSPGKYHRYWLVNGGKDFDKFRGVMETMIEDYGSDPNAKDVARVLRLAGFPHQKNPENPHRVTILESREAGPYEWDEITAVIPAKVRQAKPKIATTATPASSVGDKQIEKMIDALKHISADTYRDDWMKVGMALKIDGYPFELWDMWSATATGKTSDGKHPMYPGTETCRKIWNSFKREEGNVVRSKFIFDLAKENGWDEFKFIKDKIEELGAKKYAENSTIEDPRQQARDFLEESVADLYQLKNKDPLRYDGVVKELVKQTGYGKRTINDAIKKAGESIRKEKSITIPPEVEALFDGMKEFIYLEDHGRGHLTQIVMDKKNGFTRSKTTPRALKEAMYAGYEVYRYDPEGGIEVINFIDYWNQPFKYGHNRGPGIYKKIDFDPSPEPEAGIYNLFHGFSLQPVYDEHITDFLEFLLIHACGKDKEAYDFFLSFFAHLVQYPWLLPYVALVLRGKKGSGKSGIIDLMARIIQYSVVITKWDSVIGRFNNHLAGKLLVVLDDATWGGYKEGVGMLNNLVTSNTLLVEEKHVSPITLRNFARVVVIGNEEWLVPKTYDDRRWFVIDVPDRSMDEDFYKAFFEERWQKPENLAKLYGFLLKYDISNWKPITTVIERIDGHDMDFHSYPSIVRFVFYCASSRAYGRSVFREEDIKNIHAKVDIALVREGYYDWCKQHGYKIEYDDTRFSKAFYDVLGIKGSDKTQVWRKNSITWWKPWPFKMLQEHLCKKYKLKPNYFTTEYEADEYYLPDNVVNFPPK